MIRPTRVGCGVGFAHPWGEVLTAARRPLAWRDVDVADIRGAGELSGWQVQCLFVLQRAHEDGAVAKHAASYVVQASPHDLCNTAR